MGLRYITDENGDLRSRAWFFRTWKAWHLLWCEECWLAHCRLWQGRRKARS